MQITILTVYLQDPNNPDEYTFLTYISTKNQEDQIMKDLWDQVQRNFPKNQNPFENFQEYLGTFPSQIITLYIEPNQEPENRIFLN